MKRGIAYTWALALTISLPLAAGEAEDMIAKAEHGDAFDQAELGTAYYFGNVVPQDYQQAYAWYAVAAEGGLDDAIKHRDKTAAKLEPAELEQAKAAAAALSKRIAGLQH